MKNEQLNMIYTRMDINGMITPREYELLIKDLNERMQDMEKEIETIKTMERATSDRGGATKVPKRKVSKS